MTKPVAKDTNAKKRSKDNDKSVKKKTPLPNVAYQREMKKSKQSLVSNNNSAKQTKIGKIKSTSSNNLLSNPKLDKSKTALDHEYIFLSKTQSSPNLLLDSQTKKKSARSQNFINEYESLTNFESQNFLNIKPAPPPTFPAGVKAPRKAVISATAAAKASKKSRKSDKRNFTGSQSSLNSSRHSIASSKTSLNSNRPTRRVTFDEFMSEWERQKRLYLNLQLVFLTINFVLTIVRLGLSVALYAGIRIGILADMANKLLYSSFSKFIGFLPLLFLFINTVSFFVDISRFFTHGYILNLLDSHTRLKIERILNNQKDLYVLKQLNTDTIESELHHLRLRNRITRYLKKILVNLKAVTFMSYFIYLAIIAVQFIIGLVLHFQLDYIVSYQLPQTLIKLTREFESQQLALLTKSDTLFLKFENVITGTLEENLVNSINIYFECCNYQNPFQYGDLAPHTCNYDRGCLKPMQEFTWNYFYSAVVIVLFLASIKFLVEIILAMNFNVILLKRLLMGVYSANMDFILMSMDLHEASSKASSKEAINIDIRGERDDPATKRLLSIRRAKEAQLEKEDLEEEARRREETQMKLLSAQEKRQKAHEKMLYEQGRFEELEQERYRRRLQNQFVIIQKETK
jgi:hypothetical protein